MKTTDKQIAANRRNATLSTGPATEAGKAVARRNALKHGLLAREIVIDDGAGAESREQFEALLVDLINQFDPQGPLEEMLVERIAVACWRLRRAHRYEVGLIRQKLDNATDESTPPRHGLDVSFSSRVPRRNAEQIEAEIREAEQQRQAWQNDQARLAQLRRDAKDLQEIDDRSDNWECLYDKLLDHVAGLADGSPAEIRQSLHRAGWTDDEIWQAHIEVCTEQIEAYTQDIQDLKKRKQEHALARQVQSKLGCVPEAHGLDRLLKYEGAIDRQFYKALSELERLQRLRRGDAVPAPVNIDVTVHPEDTA